jgi:membrane-bound serine protease (ClpP class)
MTLYSGFLSLLSISPAQYWETFDIAAALVIIAVGAILVFALIKAIQLWLKPPKVAPLVEGEKVIPGEDAKADEEVYIMYRGEYWKARSPKGIVKGNPYSITGKDGPVLVLEPME